MSAPHSPPPAIEPPIVVDVEDVSHAFRDRIALRNVTFQVMGGSLHGFVGPNGAGKTTALKLVCTLLSPQSGRIRVFGSDVVRAAREVRPRMGFMPDHFSVYRQMTVFEYLDFFSAAYGLSVAERDQVIGDVLALTEMHSRRDDVIGGLSRGMQQRVSLARVLVNDPQLLLLDEPAAGLDPRARIELMAILRELKRMGKTIFISSHILTELAELCDGVTIIDRGRVKYTGPMDRLLGGDGVQTTYRLVLGGALPGALDELASLAGVVRAEAADGPGEYIIAFDPGQTSSNRLLQDVLTWEVPIVSFSPVRLHLNEAFMNLTEGGMA